MVIVTYSAGFDKIMDKFEKSPLKDKVKKTIIKIIQNILEKMEDKMFDINTTQCEKCNDTGYQQDSSGIFHICPICDGLGWRQQKREVPESTPYYPFHEPHNPWYLMPWHDQPTYNSNPVKYTVTWHDIIIYRDVPYLHGLPTKR